MRRTPSTRTRVPVTLTIAKPAHAMPVAPASRQMRLFGISATTGHAALRNSRSAQSTGARARSELAFHPADGRVAVAAAEPVEERIADHQAADRDEHERRDIHHRRHEHEVAQPRVAHEQQQRGAVEEARARAASPTQPRIVSTAIGTAFNGRRPAMVTAIRSSAVDDRRDETRDDETGPPGGLGHEHHRRERDAVAGAEERGDADDREERAVERVERAADEPPTAHRRRRVG